MEFPVDGQFRALPPQLTLAQMIERCRELREWFPNGLPNAEERWAHKSQAEFVL